MRRILLLLVLIAAFMPMAAAGQSGILAPTVTNVVGLPPGLDIWARWKASDITAVADGATITTWPDSSGNGRHLTQSTATNRPTKRTAAAGLTGNTHAVDFLSTVIRLDFFPMASPAALTEGEAFIGSQDGANNAFQGQIAEILFLRTVPTADQRAAINVYLGKEYLGL